MDVLKTRPAPGFGSVMATPSIGWALYSSRVSLSVSEFHSGLHCGYQPPFDTDLSPVVCSKPSRKRPLKRSLR